MSEATLEKTKKWYISAVRNFMMCNFGYEDEEVDDILRITNLKERLDKAPRKQLLKNVEETACELRHERYFLCDKKRKYW